MTTLGHAQKMIHQLEMSAIRSRSDTLIEQTKGMQVFIHLESVDVYAHIDADTSSINHSKYPFKYYSNKKIITTQAHLTDTIKCISFSIESIEKRTIIRRYSGISFQSNSLGGTI